METSLADLIPGVLPATMKQIAQRLGVPNNKQLWDVVHHLRSVSRIRRVPGPDGGDRVFLLPGQAVPPPIEGEKVERPEPKVKREQQVVLVSVDDWPISQPGRPMVYDVRKSAGKAHRTVERLKKLFESDPGIKWWFEPLTQERIRDLQERVDSKTLREIMVRRRGVPNGYPQNLGTPLGDTCPAS